jgi:hypothetical protein
LAVFLLPTVPGIVGMLLLRRGDGSWLRSAGWRGVPRWRPRPARPLVEGTVAGYGMRRYFRDGPKSVSIPRAAALTR